VKTDANPISEKRIEKEGATVSGEMRTRGARPREKGEGKRTAFGGVQSERKMITPRGPAFEGGGSPDLNS